MNANKPCEIAIIFKTTKNCKVNRFTHHTQDSVPNSIYWTKLDIPEFFFKLNTNKYKVSTTKRNRACYSGNRISIIWYFCPAQFSMFYVNGTGSIFMICNVLTELQKAHLLKSAHNSLPYSYDLGSQYK